jgi:hypothetical protein
LLKEFADIFAWQYDDLKTFNTEVIQHKIPLNKETKPFRQKLRSFSPMLLPTMERRSRSYWMPALLYLSGIQIRLLILYLSEIKTERSGSVWISEI